MTMNSLTRQCRSEAAFLARELLQKLWLPVCCVLLGGCASAKPMRTAGRTSGPELYGLGLFTTGAWDFFMAFSPDQRTVLFCRADSTFNAFQILETHWNGQTWSAPIRSSFADARWSDADPHFTPDGKRLFFISNRPSDGGSVASRWFDIWYVDRASDGAWGRAVHLPGPVNADTVDKWSPSVARNGNIYFGARGKGSRGRADIWVSHLVSGAYQEPENLGDSINTSRIEIEPWVAPDESYLIFSGSARDGSNQQYDLSISRRKNGVWQGAEALGNGINTPAKEFNQSVSPDGKYLYFSSTRRTAPPFIGPRFDVPPDPRNIDGVGNGEGDIYRIPMMEIAPHP